MLSQVSCVCVFGAQFLVQHFQILLIPELEQSSQRQSTALAIPGAKHTHTMPFYLWKYRSILHALRAQYKYHPFPTGDRKDVV